MTVVLHIGAHKTGTTFLQQALERAAPTLADRGVDVVPVDEARPNLSRRLREGEAEAARAWARARVGASGETRVVLSDENLIGAPARMVSERAFYPDAGGRLADLAAIFEAEAVEVMIGLRNQAQIGRSIFCEALRVRLDAVPDPATFRAGWLASAPRWQGLIETVRAAFPPARIVVWTFRAFLADPGRIANRIAALDPPHAFALDGLDRRPSLSHSATEAMLALGRAEGPRAMYHARDRMARRHPQTKGDWVYRLFEPEEEARQAALWREDLAAIAGMAGVELIDI